MGFLQKLLGGSNDSEVKALQKYVDRINELEPSMLTLSDKQLREKTQEFKDRIKNGETLDDIMCEAFAVVREGSKRALSMRHFDVQLIGGIVLHQGRIAEMKTGEGKTLVATLAAYLNALSGKGVHIVTVNDYLAKRDSEWMGKIYRFLGLSVGVILHDMDNEQRKAAYNCDITYGTNNEFGFDYLRDNMVIYKNEMVQRDLSYAIVDEVDSILIDEARTPLIISGAGDKSTEMYTIVDRFVKQLPKECYERDEKDKTVNLTDEGIERAEKHFGVENLSDLENTELNHHINQALKAHVVMKRDIDYVVQDGEVIIVDEFTGRLMTGRRYSDGLHQAIEAKENVKVARESKTLATITFQNYFRMYDKLSGMTGTAKTEEDEFRGIYKLDVVEIPTNQTMIRKDNNDVIYTSLMGKFKAVVEEVVVKHATGQPILVGTVSVEKSEFLSDMLKKRGVKHNVLNAKNHEKEAEIVAQAGKFGAVTIATNMAGRGTDILLGGNPEFLARQDMKRLGFEEDMIEEATGHADTDDENIEKARAKYQELYNKHKIETDKEKEQVIAVGGLHIIGTERHESRRIDNQLRGRSGRQGDPGSSRFYISFEDDLLRIYGADKYKSILEKINKEDDAPVDMKIMTKQIEQAQKRIEGRNFDIRKHVLQYDDVMNTQRGIIYKQRRQVLEGQDIHSSIMEMLENVITGAVDLYCQSNISEEDYDLEGLEAHLKRFFVPKETILFAQDEKGKLDRDEIKERIEKVAFDSYANREELFTAHGIDMREIERVVLLRIVDRKWVDHIDAMDQLRQGIGIRAYGQRDPVVEYKREGYDMFEEMVNGIQEETIGMLYNLKLEEDKAPKRERVAQPMRASHGDDQPKQETAKTDKKVGRNDPCPCGSGKKYKNCCGKNL